MLADGVERLQALAGDVEDHALVGTDVAALGQLAQHRRGHAAGRLGEDSGRLGEQLDALDDLLVGDRVDRPAGAAGDVEREHAVGRIADRERLGDRLGPHRPADLVARRERLGHRAAALGLGAVEGRQRALDQAEVEPLLEARGRSW